MPRMSGGRALVQQLKLEGVDTIFGLPGVQLDHLFDALYDERDAIRLIHTRHEQGTAYMADGFARATGRVGTCLVVPGPGLLNTAAALATAYACSSPVLCLTGQIETRLIGLGRGALHEVRDQMQAIAPVTKWQGRALSPAEIPGLVHEAFRQLLTGRPRPVELEVPPDVLAAEAEVQLREPALFDRPAGDPELIEKAAKALGEARSPLIFAGGGVLRAEAWEELRQLAETLEAPVIMTNTGGRGALSDRHHLAFTDAATRHLVPSADVVLAVGTRFLVGANPQWQQDGKTVIQLDIDPEELGRNLTPQVAIEGDAKAGLAALVERVGRYNRRRPSRQEELAPVHARVQAQGDQMQPQAELGMAIRAELPDDGIFVNENTQVGYWARSYFPIYEPRTYIGQGYQGTLGAGFATAIGAQIGRPDRRVVSINGDGGFFYNLPEISTLMQQKVPLVVIVFNDNRFGNVRRQQEELFGGRFIAVDLYNPDFMKLADAFNLRGRRAKDAKELRRELRAALALSEPTLIEVPVGPMEWYAGRPTPQTR